MDDDDVHVHVNDMNAEELRAEIARVHQHLELRRERADEADNETDEATERQRLRRELEAVQKDVEIVDCDIDSTEQYNENVDLDDEGEHAPRTKPMHAQRSQHMGSALKSQKVVDAAELVEKAWTVWKIKGMSWLIAALAQEGVGTHASGRQFFVGGSSFDLVYNPTAAQQGGASLSLRHRSTGGLTCRYKFLVLHADGEFHSWGQQTEVIAPNQKAYLALYGPDTPAGGPFTITTIAGHQRQAEDGPIGVMGLDHQALTASEWVTEDCLTVKIELEVRASPGSPGEWWLPPTVKEETPADRIKIPEPCALANMGALFRDGTHDENILILAD